MGDVKPVAVIGDPGIDIYLATADVRHLSDKVLGHAIGRFGGGTAANFAAWTARLGHPAVMIGRIGDDAMGSEALADIQQFGVRTDLVERQDGTATTYTVVLVDERGERFIVIAPAFDARPPAFTPAVEQTVEEAAALYVMWHFPDLARRAIAAAKRCGVPVVMDVERTVLEIQSPEIVGDADLVFFNREGLEAFAPGLAPEAALRRALAMGPQVAVVTLGPEGCWVASQQGLIRQQGFPVTAVDSTGAGDAFQAAFLFGHLRNWPLERTVAFAAAAGAIAVTAMGPRQGATSCAEVERFLRHQHA